MNKDVKKALQKEAVRRMKELRMDPKIISDFKNGQVLISYYSNNVLDAITEIPDDTVNDIVKEFYEEYEGLVVYHIQIIGPYVSLIYVSSETDMWPSELEKRTDGTYLCEAYVYNMNCPVFSEFGSIVIKPSMRGITRVA